MIEDVQNFLFAPPFPTKTPRMDLASMNIVRGRDHGLDTYTVHRKALGLAPVHNFSQVTHDGELAAILEELYGSPSNCDLFVCGVVEDRAPADPGTPVAWKAVGETFAAQISQQFSNTRDGDRYYSSIRRVQH